MTTKADLTPAEAQLWLARLDRDCALCGGRGKVLFGDGWGGCSNCHGSGKAPVLPDLRKPCGTRLESHWSSDECAAGNSQCTS